MEQLIETVEDLQLRAFNSAQIYNDFINPPSQKQLHSLANANRCITNSSRYGICIVLGNQRRLYSLLSSDIHKLGLERSGEQKLDGSKIRTTNYHNQQAELISIATNCDGSILSVAIQTSNGPFVDIFDITCFEPSTNRQPFPLTSIRLSTINSTYFHDFEWNPMEPDFFATIMSDGTISTIKCMTIQGRANNSNIFASLNLSEAICLSWSPKGKQLIVGDANGKMHQLKPELSGPPVRQIEPPMDIPAYERQPLSCISICWLSTTEWFVAHQPKQSQSSPMQPPNISLLCLKKQQPPKWTHFGDVLPTSRSRRLTFVPMLDWHLVFLYSSDSIQIALFGQRGEFWRKFEFETFDIEMPLALDGRSNTFPMGATLDFSSIILLNFDQMQIPPPPMLHLLNSNGKLLPYAIVSLNPNPEQRPRLNKPPEKIQLSTSRFGQPPPNWVPPSTPTQNQNTVQQSPLNQLKSSIAFSTPLVNSPKSAYQTPPSNLTTQIESRKLFGDQQQTIIERKKIEEENAKEMQKKIEEEKQKANLEMEEQKKRIENLDKTLERNILEYTQMRNIQAQKVDQQIRKLRYEIERKVSTTDLVHFNKLILIRNELLDGLRQKTGLMDELCRNIQKNGETLNQLKFTVDEWKREGPKKNAGQLSFDIQKRIELVEENYEKTMNNFEQAKRALNNLDGQIQGNILGGNCIAIGRIDKNEVIDPLEQRKLIQTNENIAKMCSKMNARLQQIQREIENIGGGMMGKKQSKVEKQGSVAADYCLLEIGQLNIDGGGTLKQFPTEMGENIGPKFQQNLHNYLMNLDQFKEAGEPAKIHLIQPIRSSSTKTQKAQTKPSTSIDEQNLTQIMNEVFATPPKPECHSIGVQSPDFMMEKAKPNKIDQPKQTPIQIANTKSLTIPTTFSTLSIPETSSLFAAPKEGHQIPFLPAALPTPPIFSPISSSSSTTNVAEAQKHSTGFIFKLRGTTTTKEEDIPNDSSTNGSSSANANIVELPTLFGPNTTTKTITQPIKMPPITSTIIPPPPPTIQSTIAAAILQQVTLPSKTTTNTSTTPSTETKLAENVAQQKLPTTTTTIPTTIPTTISKGIAQQTIQQQRQGEQQNNGKVVENASNIPSMDEGMEDETTMATAPSSVTFDFMKGIGLGCAPNTSTPMNAASNRNPFGSIAAAPQNNTSTTSSGGLFGNTTGSGGAFGQSPFGTPQSQFGTPNRTPNSAFGSFGTPAASSPGNSSGSGFGQSPFGSNAFGAKPTFGSQSPFAASTTQKSVFGGGGSTFGGGMGAIQPQTNPGVGGSMFGGGFGSSGGGGGTVFSAFASKSSAFGQLANQAQGSGSGGGSSSLFGGGTNSSGSTNFTGFGSQNVPSTGQSPFGGQQKSSAFTTFRK